MEQILANVRGLARVAVENGREYRVAPVSLIVPGVLSGSKGALYYPDDEVRRDPGVWNGYPLVVYHPTANGRNVSAKDPSVRREVFVGEVRNDHWDGKKRRAEAWFDVEAVRNYDAVLRSQGKPEILPRLLAGQQIEVSTGLFTDNEEQAGTWNGKAYTHVARNYRPDHLAILPDQRGACSVSDGCGVFNADTGELGFNNEWFDGFWSALVTGNGHDGDAAQSGPEETAECGCDHIGCSACGKAAKVTGNALPNQPKSKVTGKYKTPGSGTGAGEVHESAQRGGLVLTDADRELGRTTLAEMDATQDRNPPSWVGDVPKWDRATEAAGKGGYEGEAYWAVASAIYTRMGGEVLAGTNNAFCPTGEGGGIDNSCSPGGGGGTGEEQEITSKGGMTNVVVGEKVKFLTHTGKVVDFGKFEDIREKYPDATIVAGRDVPEDKMKGGRTWAIKFDDGVRLLGSMGMRLMIKRANKSKPTGNADGDSNQTGPESKAGCDCDGQGCSECTPPDQTSHITGGKHVTNKYRFEGEDCPECGASMEGDPDSGKCNSCGHSWGVKVDNSLFDRPKSQVTGRFKPLGAGTGKGESHEAAQRGAVDLIPDDHARGADAKAQTEAGHPTPSWAADPAKWDKATAAARKGNYPDDQYWAVSAHIYRRSGGEITEGTNNAFCPTGEGGGVDPSCKGSGGGSDASADADKASQHAGVEGSNRSVNEMVKARNAHTHAAGMHRTAAKTAKGKDRKKYHKDKATYHESRAAHYKAGILTLTGNDTSYQESDMTKPQLVQYLTTNCECWKGAEKVLNSMDEAQLKKIHKSAVDARSNEEVFNTIKKGLVEVFEFDEEDLVGNDEAVTLKLMADKKAAMEEPEEEEEEVVTPPVKNAAKTGTTNNTTNEAQKPMTTKEWLEQMPPEAQAVWNTAVEINDQAKKDLIGKLVANVKDPELRKRLVANHAKKTIPQLRDEVAALPVAAPTRNQKTNAPTEGGLFGSFIGAGVGIVDNSGSDDDADSDDVLDTPTITDNEFREMAAFPKAKHRKNQPATAGVGTDDE